MKRSSLFAVALLLGTLSAVAQQPASPSLLGSAPPPQNLVSLRLSVAASTGGGARGEVTATIAEGWHINSYKPLDDFLLPTDLIVESPALEIEHVDYPPHQLESFSFSEGKELAVYQGTIRIPFGARKLMPSGPVTASLRYQACNDRLCLPPKTVSVTSSLGPALTSTPEAGGAGFVPLKSAPQGERRVFSSDIQQTFASRGLPLTLLVVFLLGLALNLTPCVYPLIPITLAFFSSQSEGKRSRRVALSLSYVLGLALTYSALGVFSALSGRLFGAWLQLPAVLIFFAALMLVLSASMFGLFEIRVPHFITDRAGGRVGVLGSLTMGLLVGIVAAPCVGPFVISLIALVGQKGSPLLGFLLFFVLALGLGLPYLILGIFSSGLASVPRSGVWMLQVKKAMGFILIAMAFYFLRSLVGEPIYRGGVAISLLAGAVYLALASGTAPGTASRGGTVLRLTCALFLLAGGLWFALQRSKEGLTWTPYDTRLLTEAAAAGRPVLIDFYADWCLPCKELDQKTFTKKEVISEGERFLRLKADLTSADDPKVKELTDRFRILGVPTIVFISKTGEEVADVRLTGFEESSKFLMRMKRVQ